MSKALVLSGGGSVGIAWQTGFAAGLAAEGVDLGSADLIVGTSAGSATGAQIALGFEMAKRVAAYKARAGEERTQGSVDQSAPSGRRGMAGLAQLFGAASPDETPEQRYARIGTYALEAETMTEEAFLRGFRYLDGQGWPPRYLCTAIEAKTGTFQVWDEAAGVELALAVGSSCAVPGVYPPITIDGLRYIDGGMRSGTNADLANGHDKVLILAMRAPTPAVATSQAPADPAVDQRMARARANTERELAVLSESGTVLVTGPDAESAEAFRGPGPEPRRLATIAETGMRQGAKDAAELAEFWS